MSIKDNTKHVFAQTLEDMMKKTPLQKITIQGLCSKCGADRQTFYYHFKDKYDLVTWVFYKDVVNSVKAYDGIHSVSQLANALTRMKEKQSFYKNAFSDYSQNSISRYINEFNFTFFEKSVKEYLHIEKLNNDIIYVIKYHSYGSLGFSIDWLSGKVDMTPVEVSELVFKNMPLLLREAYLSYRPIYV